MRTLTIPHTIVLAAGFIFSAFVSLAQKPDLETYFSALRNKQPVSPFSFHSKNESQYVKQLSTYLDDTVASIRAEAYYLLNRLGQQSKQKSTRKDVVKLLLRGWRDADPGIHGQVENSLTRFQLTDFDRVAIDSVKSLVQNPPPFPGKLFKLIGYLGLQDLAPKIKSYIEEQQPLPRSQDRWAGYVSLARLGDQHAVDLILNRVRTFGVHNDVVYEIFPDLVYTRSYRAIHYLEEVLFSNEKNCESPHADSPQKMMCAYRIAELLAPVIKDYPVALDATGDLAEDNYPKALEKIRAWFKQKNGSYEIIRDTY